MCCIETLLVERNAGWVTITLNRPAVKNAVITPSMNGGIKEFRQEGFVRACDESIGD